MGTRNRKAVSHPPTCEKKKSVAANGGAGSEFFLFSFQPLCLHTHLHLPLSLQTPSIFRALRVRRALILVLLTQRTSPHRARSLNSSTPPGHSDKSSVINLLQPPICRTTRVLRISPRVCEYPLHDIELVNFPVAPSRCPGRPRFTVATSKGKGMKIEIRTKTDKSCADTGQIESNYDEITDSFDSMDLKPELLRGM